MLETLYESRMVTVPVPTNVTHAATISFRNGCRPIVDPVHPRTYDPHTMTEQMVDASAAVLLAVCTLTLLTL